MNKFRPHRALLIGSLVILLSAAAAVYYTHHQTKPTRLSTTAVRDTVEETVYVSGVLENQSRADLAFLGGGRVASVPVQAGDTVAAGDTLMTLDARALQADRQSAVADIASARAVLAEVRTGASDSTRALSAQEVSRAKQQLAAAKTTQAQTIATAYRTLLSTDIVAYTTNPNTQATAPTISGTYHCPDQGQYQLRIYASDGSSGYSYRLTGLETETGPVSFTQPTALGSCGLLALFTASDRYHNTTWLIDLPNTRSRSYTANKNAYELAQTTAAAAIALAEEDLALAQAAANQTTAPARDEAVAQAAAALTSAQARLARIDSQLSDTTLSAPFAGTVNAITAIVGEQVGTTPVVELVGEQAYILTARIPEIDIGKLLVGQSARVQFDARPGELLPATISFIALEATEIDGVAYFEADLTLQAPPAWLRGGLNADIEIIIASVADAVHVPVRFVTNNTVLVQQADTIETRPVTTGLISNDGFVEISSGLAAGEVVIAPTPTDA